MDFLFPLFSQIYNGDTYFPWYFLSYSFILLVFSSHFHDHILCSWFDCFLGDNSVTKNFMYIVVLFQYCFEPYMHVRKFFTILSEFLFSLNYLRNCFFQLIHFIYEDLISNIEFWESCSSCYYFFMNPHTQKYIVNPVIFLWDTCLRGNIVEWNIYKNEKKALNLKDLNNFPI